MKRVLLAALAVLVVGGVAALSAGSRQSAQGAPPEDCIITVNAADDNIAVDTFVSLREAIGFATDFYSPFPDDKTQISCSAGLNDDPGAATADRIVFDLPDPSTITLTVGPLPPLDTGNDVIDAIDTVIVDGGGGAFDCLSIVDSSNNAIYGLQVQNCANGIQIVTNPFVSDNVVGYNTLIDNVTGLFAAGNRDYIIGNNIGVKADGVAVPNGTGVLLAAEATTIGNVGPAPVGAPRRISPAGGGAIPGNVISGNTGNGISVASGSDNVIVGNLIGTNAAGTAAVPNGGHGIEIVDSNRNTIGSPENNGRNVISGNGKEGVKIHGDFSTDNVVAANYIGTNAAGTAAIPNSNSGVYIIRSTDNTIGGTSPGDGNVVSGNAGFAGIAICGNPGFCGGQTASSGTDDASGTRILGNYVGTNASGTAAIPNSQGVTIDGATGVAVGGASAGAGNVISGNDIGISLFHGTTESSITGNFVGVGADGITPVPNDLGLGVDRSPDNVIGAPGAGNVVSGNIGRGVALVGEEASGNLIQGNRIGVGSDGQSAAGNGLGGILAVGSGPNVIGGTGDGEGNVIAYNGELGIGVQLVPPDSVSKRISANSIYANDGLGIDLEVDGVTPNDILDGDTGGNALQNFPGLTQVTVGAATRVEGALNSAANTEFRIEFFANDECDPSGFGEGQRYLGFTATTTDGSGNASFDADLATAAAAPGDWITATATDPDDNTSEFSPCVEAEQGEGTPAPTPTPTPPGPTATPTPASSPTPTATAAPGGILGDTDCDEDVDAVDALHDLQDVAGLEPDADCLAQAGDVQCDGDIDAVDALGILTHVAGLPPQPQDPGCPAIGEAIV